MTEVLYLSYDGITDPLGQSQILPYLKGLSSESLNFHLIGFEKPHNYEQQAQKINDEIRGFNITWHPRKYHKSPPILSTLFDIFSMNSLADRLIREEHISIVHCRSYLSMLVGIRMKKKYGVKLIFDMRGFWADERVDGKIWNLDNPLYNWIFKYFKKKEEEFCKIADSVVVLTQVALQEISSGQLFNDSNTNIDPDKISVIPCTVDFDLFNPARTNHEQAESWKKELEISDSDKILVYLGSVGTWYMLDEMFIFFKFLNKQNPNYKFLIVTKDDQSGILRTAKKMNVATDHLIITSAERSDIPAILSFCDLGISFIKPCNSKKASSATKMGEMIAMGLPIIANSGIGDTDEIMSRYNHGELVDLDLDALEKVSMNLNVSPIKNELSIDWFQRHFSLKAGTKKYEDIYLLLMADTA